MPTPLPLFTYPAAGDRNFPALGENALGTHNGLFYEGSVSTRRSGSAQQSAGWTSWNDPLRDCRPETSTRRAALHTQTLTAAPHLLGLWNVQPSAAPCQVLPASQRYVPPGLQPPKPSTSRGRVKRELTVGCTRGLHDEVSAVTFATRIHHLLRLRIFVGTIRTCRSCQMRFSVKD